MNQQITFATRFRPPTIKSKVKFDKFEPCYEMTLDEKGQKKLIKKGKTNIYEKIQMYKDDCDVYKIIQRASMGDTSLLEKRAGMYTDISEMPTNLQETFEYMHKAQQDFERLPREIKDRFDNNVYKFAAMTQEQLNNMIDDIKGIVKKEIIKHEEIENKGVTENEQKHGT